MALQGYNARLLYPYPLFLTEVNMSVHTKLLDMVSGSANEGGPISTRTFLDRGRLYSATEYDLRVNPYAWEGAEVEQLHTRKSVEKLIKRLGKELEELRAQRLAMTDSLGLVEAENLVIDEETGWEIYLSPSARLARGEAMNHCLGKAVGQAGDPYIAVGTNADTYGFRIENDGYIVEDQGYAAFDKPIAQPDWGKATALAHRYAHRSWWGDLDEPTVELDRQVSFIENKLAGARRAEKLILWRQGHRFPVVIEEREWQGNGVMPCLVQFVFHPRADIWGYWGATDPLVLDEVLREFDCSWADARQGPVNSDGTIWFTIPTQWLTDEERMAIQARFGEAIHIEIDENLR
jgi:hypothetical protein